MSKQDKAFSAWLNHLLVPAPDAAAAPDAASSGANGGGTAAGGALTGRRLAAAVQGALVACYRRDASLRDAVMRVEARVDQGQLRLKDEVCAPLFVCACGCGNSLCVKLAAPIADVSVL